MIEAAEFLRKGRKTSAYRGVSKNGPKWQNNLMGNSRVKFYTKSIASEKFAARVHDRFNIQKCGLRAITNFSYTA
eukprot:CAMPEP_0116874448 /NCGR_PEP_ID=MMETSP0463-20121206/5892_1 /TAXON_ID=181622 /ORGANISM="Strombidinopsis sp, Strain SopsisLIS2011" /LENGTH=74 /DNA_ID=CAMNT_0004518067 /DNA_START=933 /DNA_END=1157 /DNA_ORIENTATION=+